MGEHIYEVEGKEISFSASSDAGCLCTFPHNDRADNEGELVIDKQRLMELALLGCAVAVIHNTEELKYEHSILLPGDINEYYQAIRAAVRKIASGDS